MVKKLKDKKDMYRAYYKLIFMAVTLFLVQEN